MFAETGTCMKKMSGLRQVLFLSTLLPYFRQRQNIPDRFSDNARRMQGKNMPDTHTAAHIQSRVLIESLPYLQEYHHKMVVVKYGGHAMADAALKRSFALNIALLKLVGVRPVVVHGGGPQINTMLDKLAIKSEFRQGQRVTDDAVMDVVEMVLVGSVNKAIVNQINQAGAKAVGLSGKDGHLLGARKLPGEDLGNVGEIVSVNIQLLHSLMRDDFVPVIAPVGVDGEGKTYNVNADSVAGAVAGALKAKRLLLLTDVAGILTAQKELLPHISMAEAETCQSEGVISGGMIPKTQCAFQALRAGVERVTIVDGRVENCVLLELLTKQGIGTQIVP